MKYVTLFETKEKPSCCAKRAKKHGHNCCNDKEVKLDIGDQHHAKAKLFVKQTFDEVLTIPVYALYAAPFIQPTEAVITKANAPPLIHKVRLHILNCTYLI